jgi:hypothetical protein
MYAQTTLPSGKIEVVKDFEVRLAESKKIRIVPQPVQVDSTVRQYEYKLLAPSPSIEYLIPELKPLAIQAERKPAYYPFYARLGYGSPNSLLGMISYDHVQDEKFSWGADLRHLSANNKKIPVQKFSDSRGRLDATYLLNDHVQLEGYLDGHAETHYFYGADPIPNNEESLKRVFSRADVFLALSRPHADESSFTYKGVFQYLSDKDDLGSRERGVKIGGEMSTRFGNDLYPVGLKAYADISTLTHTDEHSLNNVLFNPWFGYYIGDLDIHLGANILLSNRHNEFMPDIELAFRNTPSLFTWIAGWTSWVDKNNFHTLSTYNPYISTRLDSLTNTVSRRIYAGFRGGMGSTSYEVKGYYTSFEGMSFFLQDEGIPEEFLPVYDDGSYIGFEGSIKFEPLNHVYLRAQLMQRFYSLDHESKPWHRPSFGFNGQITYGGDGDQFHVSLIFNAENGLPYRTVGGTESVLDPLIDLNLHGDYYFSGSFGAFAEVNNIFGNNRERWASYPSFGFNAKAGILFRLQ